MGSNAVTLLFSESSLRFPDHGYPSFMNTSLSLTPRPLHPETTLQGQRVTVIPPRESAPEVTRAILAKLEACGATAAVISFGEDDALKTISGPVILWGNLANNDAVRELYFKFLLVTDCRYPGPGGYELRTLMNPLGTGSNMIHLGYSDAAGWAIGWEKLLAQLAPITPRLAEVNATALPMADYLVDAIRTADFPPLDWMLPSNVNNNFKGYLGYLEGNADLVAHYQEVWRRILAIGIAEKDHNLKDLHLRISLMVSSFRLYETAGLIDEELRGPILKFFVDWTNSDQGISRLPHEGNLVPGIQRQNHGTIPALALAYFTEYLRDFYPEIEKEPAEWEVLSNRVFEVYWEGSWKPASEGLCHGWYLEQPVLLEYGLLDPQHRFFTKGGAARAADCAMAVVNNFGWMPASGDAHLLRSFPSDSLRTAAAWYRNEEYCFVEMLAPDDRRLRSHVFLPRAFDIGVRGKTPPAGVTVVPLDPLVHGAHEKAPDAAPWMFKVPPSAPVEKCFDKVAMREGWNRDDAYLLIDGIGGGSHAYDDALDLIEYSRLGHSFLVSDSGLQTPEPDSHAIVTVARDGVCAPTPCFGECDESTWDEAKKEGYARLLLRHNNGSTWTRELFFLSDKGVIIHDHIVAEEAGEFTIQCNLRIPGKVEHGSGETIARRTGEQGAQIVFNLQSIVPDEASLQIVEQDKKGQVRDAREQKGTAPEDDVVEAWYRRYNTKDIQLSIVRSRVHRRLKVGEGVSFVHYAHARLDSEAEPSLSIEGERGFAIEGFAHPIVLKSHFPLGLAAPAVAASSPVRETTVGQSRIVLSELGGRSTGSGPCGGVVKKLVRTDSGDVLVVLTSGRVICCDESWQRRWEAEVAGPVHDADADDERLYLGHGPTGLTALSIKDGTELWHEELVRLVSSCSWWEWFSCAALCVVAARPQSGFTGVVVGCGDMHVRAYTPEGSYRWKFRYVNGIPGVIDLMDVNGDGVDELLVSGEVMSNRAWCRVVNSEGNLLQEVEVEWWTSRMTAQAISEDGKWVAFGANWGRNLRLAEINPSADQPLHEHWLKYLPGSTTAMLIDAPEKHLLVGNSMGLFYCYDFSGEQLSRLAFEAGISLIARIGDGFLIGLENGAAHCLHLDSSGAIQSIHPWIISGDWKNALALDDALLVPTDQGLELTTMSD